ncbi:MAG: hypothetical protein ACREPG_05950, partial [Candidatus Binatia bacterium]
VLKRVKTETDKARKRAKDRRRQKLVETKAKATKIMLAPGSELRRLNGIWFAVKYTVSPEGHEIVDEKRQLSTKELRERELVNQPV